MWNSVTLTNPGQIWKLLKIHARGCGTLISHTHWNLDGGLNAMVHVATPPVAANSPGQRLQISFAALRSSSLHRSDRQFFLNLSSCINKTISTFQPWNCPFHSVLILPTKENDMYGKKIRLAHSNRGTRILKATPVHHAATKSEEAKAILNSTLGSDRCLLKWHCMI